MLASTCGKDQRYVFLRDVSINVKAFVPQPLIGRRSDPCHPKWIDPVLA